jgi:Serine/threonine protein kinase
VKIKLHLTIDRREFYSVPSEIVSVEGKTYELLERIGSGGNGVVHECIDIHGNQYAVKFLLRFGQKITHRFLREVELMKTVRHHHLIKYIDSGITEVTSKRNSSSKCHFVIMEKAEKNLLQLINSCEYLTYDIYAPQFRGLAEALAVFHNVAIHRDIKPENILVKGENWILSDYGVSSYIEDSAIELTGEHEKIGPRFWMSPEAMSCCINANKSIDMSSDVYQLCAVFWFVVTKAHPSGILTEDDWNDNDKLIYNVMHKSLLHNHTRRPQSGQALYEEIYKATILRS